MEEQQREIEQRARDRLAVHSDVLFVEMPAARPRNHDGGLVVQTVSLAVLLERNGAAHRVADVDLAVDHVEPGRAIGVLEIRHEGRCAAIERIDHHLAVGRSGDLDPAVEHVLGLWRNLPVVGADILRLGQKIGQLAAIEFLLPCRAAREQFFAARAEPALQLRDQRKRFRGQDLGKFRRDTPSDRHSLRKWVRHVHCTILGIEMAHRNIKMLRCQIAAKNGRE